MKNWDRTFKKDEVRIDGYRGSVDVWSAIHETPAIRALGKIEIHIDSDHGSATTSFYMTPQQMHDLAFNLNVHANRLKELEAEAAALTQEAA